FVVDAIDIRLVRSRQRPAQLHEIGRISEHEVDAAVGELLHLLDAVALDNLVFEMPRHLVPLSRGFSLDRTRESRVPRSLTIKNDHSGEVIPSALRCFSRWASETV